ncbi:hypothetical protein G7Y89_g15754 [Cudoniella acicularis]|uniref:Uncharacterized protein n=1 Tax=Cudoniella acicularis TaxID=354080 RepID=A0A8H4QGL3_9HELO|nr:hypothetical protein G7Y89_g15754 [Cudoniella acicularis]
MENPSIESIFQLEKSEASSEANDLEAIQEKSVSSLEGQHFKINPGDQSIIDFAPNDPENPLNWPLWRKLSIVILAATAQMLTKSKEGYLKPEHRLPLMLLGSVVLPLGLFLYGWSAEKRLHWIVPLIGTGVIGFNFVSPFNMNEAKGNHHEDRTAPAET